MRFLHKIHLLVVRLKYKILSKLIRMKYRNCKDLVYYSEADALATLEVYKAFQEMEEGASS